MHSKTLPSGCDQQGRHNTRRERWIEQEWRETMDVQRRESAPVVEPEQEQPYSIGDAVMAAAILSAIAGILSYGPWL